VPVVFPLDVEEALSHAGVVHEALIIERRDADVRVRVGCRQRSAVDVAALTARMTSQLGISVEIEILDPAQVPVFLHKTKRVVDDVSRDVFLRELEFQRELEHV
jgi:phenylacetate-coenzyme A ligase PaaK-like adenylate-forming protein